MNALQHNDLNFVRRGWYRTVVAFLTVVIAVGTFVGGPAYAAAAPVRNVNFDIPAQSMATALLRFSEQTGLQVTAQGETLQVLNTTGVRGEYLAAEALGILLKGSGLTYKFVDEETVVVRGEGERVSPLARKERGSASEGVRMVQAASASPSVQGEDGGEDQKGSRGASASSEAEKSKVQEIVVTAQRREQDARDVPMSISAVSGEELEARGIQSIRDLQSAVPSLTVDESGPGRQAISIRGISAARGTSSLTGVYLDEMPVSGLQDGRLPAYADLRILDLQRVEVLKGPQGTLFGDGAAGGVIRFITNAPNLSEVSGDISTEVYNTDDGGWSEEVTGILNLPLGDQFGIRIAARYENTSGWIDQPAGIPAPTPPSGQIGQASIGREDINDSEVSHVRLRALYEVTPDLRIVGTAELHRNEGGASNFVNWGDISESNFVQAYDRNAPTDYVDEYEMYNLAITYDLGFAEFLSSTSHAKLDSGQSETQFIEDNPADASTDPYLELLIRDYQLHQTSTTQEFRLSSLGQGPWSWTLGGTYKDAELDRSLGAAGLNAIVGAFGYFSFTASANSPQTTLSESWAVFADTSYLFFDRLELGGGVRYFSDQREFSAPPAAPLSADFNKTTYRAYARYVISDDANVYFTAGNGFRSGEFNNAAAIAGGAVPQTLPETTMSYELGAKVSLWDGRLRFDAAAFRTEYQDMVEAGLISTVPIVGYAANGQSAEIEGLELSLRWRATDALTLALSGDVTHSEITEADPTNPSPIYFVGDPVNNVPEYGVQISGDYRFNWGSSSPGFVLVNYSERGQSHVSDRTGVILLDRQVVSNPLHILNASLGGELGDWRWSVFGRNLLNEDELMRVFISGLNSQLRPRTFGISVGRSF